MANDLVLVGRVIGVHGVRGSIKLQSYTSEPDSIGRLGALLMEGGRRAEIVLEKRLAENLFVGRVSGIESRNEAEALKNERLYLRRSDLPELQADEFYWSDLIGMTTQDSAGNFIGTIKSVQDYGAGAIIEVERADGDLLLPFNKKMINEVDIKANKIIVNLPDFVDVSHP